MPKYLFEVNYVGDGVEGLLKEGGTGRRAAAEALVSSLGGTLEAYYFAFGATDVYAIAELPDHAAATALALTVDASGAAKVQTIVLMPPEEIDQAAKKSPNYRPPGR